MVLQRACPMKGECACAQSRDTFKTESVTWSNQKIVHKILKSGNGVVFLERLPQMEEVLLLLRNRQNGSWSSDNQDNPVLCVPNSPGTGKSLFLAMLGQALEAGALAGRPLGETFPNLTASETAYDKAVVSPFTYNSAMADAVSIGNPGAALFSRALYGALGVKCTQLQSISFEEFAEAAMAQPSWGTLKRIMGEYKELTAGAEKENTAFVLLVDELAKICCEEDPSEFAQSTLSVLSDWLNESPNHLVVVTALHEAFIRAGVTGSNRNVVVATILADLSCVNGSADALVPVYCESLDVDESALSPGVRLNLQRTIALTGGHPRSLHRLYDALRPSAPDQRLRQEILKDAADWKTIVKHGFDALSSIVASGIRRRLAHDLERPELWNALSDALHCREVGTGKYKALVEEGALHLAGSVSDPEAPKARVDTKPAALLLLLHAAQTPGCRVDPWVLQLAGLLFKDIGRTGFGLDPSGLPVTVDENQCTTAFTKGRLSESAERVVCWGISRLLVADQPDMQSRLLGAGVRPPADEPVSIVPPQEASVFETQLFTALTAGETAIHMTPAHYTAADFYLVNQTDVEAGQIILFWNATDPARAIAAIRRSASKVRAGRGVLMASRFVLVVCSDVPQADIVSLTAPATTTKEAPEDAVFVASDVAKFVPRSLMRLVWMGIPTESEHDDVEAEDSGDEGTV